jgi:hypothetical protein
MVRIDIYVNSIERETYKLVDIPTSMLAPFFSFGHSLMNAKMPVHVGCLLLSAFFISLKATSTLCAGGTEMSIENRDEVRSGTMRVSKGTFFARREIFHTF